MEGGSAVFLGRIGCSLGFPVMSPYGFERKRLVSLYSRWDVGSKEDVLAALSSPLLAEAQLLRDREMIHYQAHILFGGGHRLRSNKADEITGDGARGRTITVPLHDQVYKPSEDESIGISDPYADVSCTECNRRTVPLGDWYCRVSEAHAQFKQIFQMEMSSAIHLDSRIKKRGINIVEIQHGKELRVFAQIAEGPGVSNLSFLKTLRRDMKCHLCLTLDHKLDADCYGYYKKNHVMLVMKTVGQLFEVVTIKPPSEGKNDAMDGSHQDECRIEQRMITEVNVTILMSLTHQWTWAPDATCWKEGDPILDLMKRVKKNFVKHWRATSLYYEPSQRKSGLPFSGKGDAPSNLEDDVLKESDMQHNSRNNSDGNLEDSQT
eukprot:Gb_19479 [translate_table: standard]